MDKEAHLRIHTDLGVPEEKIRNALFEHVIKPLGALDGFQIKVWYKTPRLFLSNRK